MAKFLLAVWPYTGHVFPNIALASVLRARGHDVAFYTGALARPMIEREGFTCFPFVHLAQRISSIVDGVNQDATEECDSAQLYERLAQHYTAAFDQNTSARRTQMKAMYSEWILGTVPQQVTDLRALLAQWKPAVLVCDPFMWGPSLVLHETQAVPVVVFSYFAGCLLSGDDAPPFGLGLPSPRSWWTGLVAQTAGIARKLFFTDIRRKANVLRQDYGLPALPCSALDYGRHLPLYLVASVPEFDYGRRDLPASVHYIGPCLWDKPSDKLPPAWLDQLPDDRPIIYVTEGTANVHAPLLLEAAAEGLADSPMQVIMTTGRHRDPAQLWPSPLAPNIRVEQWVSHSDLLPKTSVVVTHGGSGTVLSALRAGLPLVVMPMQWDHAENAQRVIEAEVGVRLRPNECSPERLRAAVERVLHDPSFRRNAQCLAAAFKRYEEEERMVRLLEGLHVGTPVPFSS